MTEEKPSISNNHSSTEQQAEIAPENVPEQGVISTWLSQQDLKHKVLDKDHLGIEIIGVEPNNLPTIAKALKNDGFNYLQCQGGYDEGPGQKLVCFYHLIDMGVSKKKQALEENSNFREVRLKVFLAREGDLKVPSLYGLFRGSDWQERETYDMFGINFVGHPHPKRLLMPEDWKGWPLRKDYIQPDFYEMQDAY